MKYLLDTNICIYIIKKKPLSVIKKLSKCKINDIGISSITMSELTYGVEKSQYQDQNRLALLEFLTMIDIYEYNSQAAHEYGVIRAELEKKGTIIGAMDLLIAAHATALNVTLVTNNVKEFKRIAGLKVANWVE
jgi:tRNA(fMet)-specific endonuclease VapC